MATPPRHDIARGPTRNQFGQPGTQYPTPNTDDLIIVETVGLRQAGSEPLEYGTPHPKEARARLVWQGETSGNSQTQEWSRIYATDRAAQDAYNAAYRYDQNSNSHRIYVRTYLEPRETYAAATKEQPLTALIGMRVTAGGTGYTSEPTVVFSGGGGSGAAAVVQLKDGVVVAVRLTAGGTGYTSAPTATVTGGGGTGATLEASVQPQAAVLVAESADSAGEQLGSRYVVVTRTYTTMPGPILTGLRWDIERQVFVQTKSQDVLGSSSDATNPAFPIGTISLQVVPRDDVISTIQTELVNGGGANPPKTELISLDKLTGAGIYLVTRWVPIATATPTWNDVIDGRYVIDAKERPYSTLEKIQLITTMGLPAAFVSYPKIAFQFPALFAFNNDYSWSATGARYEPPWPGDVTQVGRYYLEAHRTGRYPGRETNVFTFGQPSSLEPTWTVETPGVMSKYFRIPANCIHDGFTITEVLASGSQLVENIPASNPSAYVKGQILRIGVESARYMGNIWRTIVTEVSERSVFLGGGAGSSGSDNAANVAYLFALRGLGGGFEDLSRGGYPPYIKSRSSVAATYHIYGHNSEGTRKHRTIDVPSGLSDADDYIAAADAGLTGMTSISLTGAVPSGSSSLFEQSDTPGQWRLEPDVNPVDGDTLTIFSGAYSEVFTFKAAPTLTNDVQIGATMADTLTSLKTKIAAVMTTWTTEALITATATHLDITDVINCARTITITDTGTANWSTVTLLQVQGEDGLELATWSSSETLPASKVNVILLDDNLQRGAYSDPASVNGNLDPYVSGESNQLVLDNVSVRLKIEKPSSCTMAYRYKVAGVYGAWIGIDGTNKIITVPATTGLQIRLTNGASRRACYVAAHRGVL